MESTLNDPTPEAWMQIAPLLDDAMADLGERDRAALVLRYFENRTAAEIAEALKVNEDAAQKRVTRALEKLRKIFSKRGVTLTATLVAGAISANSVQAAPGALAATITATTTQGTLVSAAITTLVKGTMKTMTWLKIKFAVGVSTAAILTGGVATVALSSNVSSDGPPVSEIIKKSQDAYAALTSYSDEGTVVATVGETEITTAFKIKLARPDLYRVEWEQVAATAGFASARNTQLVWSEGKGDFLKMGGAPTKYDSKDQVLAAASGVSSGAASSVPGAFFKMNRAELGAAAANATKQRDEKVEGADCYVIASELKGAVKTLWIGKGDLLIHQVRTVTSAAAMRDALDKAAERNPEVSARMAKMEPKGTTIIQTHAKIVVNAPLVPADFAP